MSPHLDDAVLSAGATLNALTQSGARVVVATAFAADAPLIVSDVARAFHRDCGLPDDQAMQVRRAEDRRALAVLGCRPVHLDLQDAIYRRCADGTWRCLHERAMFEAHLSEADLNEMLLQRICLVIETLTAVGPIAAVLTCAALGGHVDHLVTRAAVCRAAADRQLPVACWEDLPYMCGADPVQPGVQIVMPPTSQSDWRAKVAAVACYASQTQMLWSEQPGGWDELVRHAHNRGTTGPTEQWWKL